jgi:hypothetical protein
MEAAMCSSSSSVSSSTDVASLMVAAKQASISQQASLKAAAMVMDVEKDSGARLIESLIKSANANSAAVAEGSVDVLA